MAFSFQVYDLVNFVSDFYLSSDSETGSVPLRLLISRKLSKFIEKGRDLQAIERRAYFFLTYLLNTAANLSGDAFFPLIMILHNLSKSIK